MKPKRAGSRLLILVAALVTIVATFLLFVRPWYLRWGATDEEMLRQLPGDEIVGSAAGQETRAITIDAPADQVWPWIAQLGIDRGGFYSYDLLENIVGCEMPTVDSIRPDKLAWSPGDRLWMYPPDKADGIGYATLRGIVPGRALAFATRRFGTTAEQAEDGSWSFVVEPVDESTSRILVRGRGAAGRSLLGTAFDQSIFEPAHFVMERRMLIGIKDLAETGNRARNENHVNVVLWMIVLGLFVTAAIKLLRDPDWRRPLAGLLASAAVFQILTFLQPPLIIAFLLVGMVCAVLWSPVTKQSRVEVAG
jgi:hypothetical protein